MRVFMAGAAILGQSQARTVVVSMSSAMPWASLASTLAVAGGDEHQVGPVGQGHVLHLEGVVAVEGVHRHPVAGELLEGNGGEELGGVAGHDHLHVAVLA